MRRGNAKGMKISSSGIKFLKMRYSEIFSDLEALLSVVCLKASRIWMDG